MSVGTKIFPPEFEVVSHGNLLSLRASGDWILDNAAELDRKISDVTPDCDYQRIEFDLSEVKRMDTAGAFLLARFIRVGPDSRYDWEVSQGDRGQRNLMNAAAEARMGRPPPETRPWYNTLYKIGVATERFIYEVLETLAFIGRFFVVFARMLLQPGKIRWKSTVALIEEVGLNAAPIVMVLSFFIGAVIAYMGANLLASFGASIFMVDLVGVSMLRELAVIITAVLLAGRSDSAFTAQIGAMKMRQEIDAMTVMGLDTYEVLVVPRALACLVAAPALTFLAMMSGIFGGMLVAWVGTDVSPVLFFTRLQDVIGIRHFWVGLVKTPVFGLIIAIIGCRHGLAVAGSVDSLGARTTTSVVQAIFAVIAVDAIFAILFYQMDV